MKDRFDLENEITSTHLFSEHLRLISYGILENEISSDEIVNAIEGVAQLLDLHLAKTFDVFKQTFSLDQYSEHATDNYI
jgi:hypothetical protein